MDTIQKTLFSIYLDKNYPENRYLYEKKLHQERMRYFYLRAKLPRKGIYAQIDSLIEIITSLGNLRYQIKDHSTFAICARECIDLSTCISNIIKSLFHRNNQFDRKLNKLLSTIQSFETIYHSALQVVCPNPIVFLLFIHNLKFLHNELSLLSFDNLDTNTNLNSISFFKTFKIENFLIYFRPADVTFRNMISPILIAYIDYSDALIDLFLQKKNALENADNKRMNLEKIILKYTPLWVYGYRLGISLRPGHQYFLMTVERIEQLLFCIHQIVRHTIDTTLTGEFHDPIIAFANEEKKIIQALLAVLSLNTIPEGISDLSNELSALEITLKKTVPSSLELLDLSQNTIYLTALTENFKNTRIALLQLAQTLR